MAGFTGEQNKTKERKKWIVGQLRKGKLPKNLIEEVMEKFDLGYDMAEKLVYDCNKAIRESLQDLYDNAAEYLVNNVQALAEQAIEDKDKKSAIKAYELLAKITKVGQEENKTTINLNFGFSFDEDEPTGDRD